MIPELIIKQIVHKENLLSFDLIPTGQSNKLKFIGRDTNANVYYFEALPSNQTDSIRLFKYFEKPELINVYKLDDFWIHKFSVLPEQAIRIDRLFSSFLCSNYFLENVTENILCKISSIHDSTLFFTDHYDFQTLLSNVKYYRQYFESLLNSIKCDKPFAIIHGDFHLKNMYFLDNNIYLLDYEYAGYESVFIDYIKLETSMLIHLNRKDFIWHFESNEYSKYLTPSMFLNSNCKLINIVRNYAYSKLSVMTYDAFYKTYILYIYYYFTRFMLNDANSTRNKVFVKSITKYIHRLTSHWQ